MYQDCEPEALIQLPDALLHFERSLIAAGPMLNGVSALRYKNRK